MSLPAPVRSAMGKLPASMQKAFMRDHARRKQSLLFAYLPWLLPGWHYLDLRRVALQFAFWITVGGFFVWRLLDLFQGPRTLTF